LSIKGMDHMSIKITYTMEKPWFQNHTLLNIISHSSYSGEASRREDGLERDDLDLVLLLKNYVILG
jgi:hypothetical protein